jgi:hypothetical protein
MPASINLKQFSSFEAGKQFAGEPSLDLRQGSYDMDFLGGSWDFDQLEGVEVLFGEKAPDRVGVLTLVAASEAQNPNAASPLVDPDWAKRANRGAQAIGLPSLLCRPLAELLAAFPTLQVSEKWEDGRRQFATGVVGEFQVQGIVHDIEGLLWLEIQHLPTVNANRHRS